MIKTNLLTRVGNSHLNHLKIFSQSRTLGTIPLSFPSGISDQEFWGVLCYYILITHVCCQIIAVWPYLCWQKKTFVIMANKVTLVSKMSFQDFPTFRHENILNQARAKALQLVTEKLTDFVCRLPRSRHHVNVPQVAMKDLSKTQSRIEMSLTENINISKKNHFVVFHLYPIKNLSKRSGFVEILKTSLILLD